MEKTKKGFERFALGLRLKKLRNKAGLSLKQLAADAGLSHSYLNEIEKGKKYPKKDKILSVAQRLGVGLEELLSSKTSKSLRPLESVFARETLASLPLDLYGIDEQSLFELASRSPEKISALVTTLKELSRIYGLNLEALQKAALRSHQSVNNNHFPAIEELALEARTLFPHNIEFASSGDLKDLLVNKFGYVVDDKALDLLPETRDLPCAYSEGRRPVLLLGSRLSEQRKRFVLAYEIGRCAIKGASRRDQKTLEGSFQAKLRAQQSAYFAQAFLIDKNILKTELEDFFSNENFNPSFLERLGVLFNTGPETLIHRISQLLPSLFGMKEAFFLRFSSEPGSAKETFKANKELHLSELHEPHGIKGREHYCRRWITIWLLRQTPKDGGRKARFEAQRSIMQGGSEFLCLGLSKLENRKAPRALSLTIGIKITPQVEERIRFLKSPSLKKVNVGHTCERCPEQSCLERAAPPAALVEKEDKRKQRRALKELFREVARA